MKSADYETNLFCWRRGFKAKDLGDHPCADDIVLLVSIKDEFWNHITKANKTSLECFWKWVYVQKQPLRNKHLTKLKHIVTNGNNTRLYKQKQTASIRHKILRLRQNPTT